MSNYYSTTVAFVLFQLKKHSAQEIKKINLGELSNINFIVDVINVSNCLRINKVLKSETLHFLQINSISSFCLTSMAAPEGSVAFDGLIFRFEYFKRVCRQPGRHSLPWHL